MARTVDMATAWAPARRRRFGVHGAPGPRSSLAPPAGRDAPDLKILNLRPRGQDGPPQTFGEFRPRGRWALAQAVGPARQ
jgi:hypothetical protein